MAENTIESILFEEAIDTYTEIKDYLIVSIEKYQKKCEVFRTIITDCNKNINKYKELLSNLKNNNEISNEKENAKLEDKKSSVEIVKDNIKSVEFKPDPVLDNKPIIPKSNDVNPNEPKTNEPKPGNSKSNDTKPSNPKPGNIKSNNKPKHNSNKKISNENKFNDVYINNEEYTEVEENESEYEDYSDMIENENNKKNNRNKYKPYYIINNKSDSNTGNNKVYYVKVISQIKPPIKEINYGSIPESWHIPKPKTKLLSEYYKEYLKDGSLVTRIYHDMNLDMREKIKITLRKFVPYNTTEQFINRIKTLSKTNKYFFKTDIIGAYYNTNLNTILQNLRPDSGLCKHYEEYLIGFFDFIKNKEQKEEYLYITNYSPLLFGAYLKKILGDVKFISRYDDIILYGNSLEDIKTQFDKTIKILLQHGLFLNKNKSVLYNTDVNSIFVLKTLINIPASGKLDEITKNILKEYNKNGEYIKIVCVDKNNIIKSALTS